MEWLMVFLGIIPIIIAVVAAVYVLCNRDQFKANKSTAKAHLYEKIQFACVCWWLAASTITETAMEMKRIASASDWSVIGTHLLWLIPIWFMGACFFEQRKSKFRKVSIAMIIVCGLAVAAEAIYSVLVFFVA